MMIFELNSRVHGKRFDQITDEELTTLTGLGFDWIWMMGIWQISAGASAVARQIAPDYQGSPYAISEYQVNPDLGGETAFREFVARAHKVGLRVMADFVPNHMAIDSPLIDQHPEFFIHSNPALRDEKPHDYFIHSS